MTFSSCKFTTAALFLLVLPLTLLSCSRSNDVKLVSERRNMLSTVVAISVPSEDEKLASSAIESGFGRVEELNKLLNAHDENSELGRLNNAEGPLKVSPDMLRALRIGIEWHDKSNGAFNISVDSLRRLWIDSAKEGRLPLQEEIEQARERTNIQDIKVDEVQGMVQLPAGLKLDLGGLGKGFCADEVAARMREKGVQNALIALAGDICAMGERAPGVAWRVGVQDPRDPDNPAAILTVLELTNRSVSTSGNYQRYVEIQGKKYSHIVDPRTGWTADNVPSVTVIGPDTVTTDILGTALSVLGVEEGLKLVESMPDVEALFIIFDESDKPIMTRSSRFVRFEAKGG